jgi:hypothetical protein
VAAHELGPLAHADEAHPAVQHRLGRVGRQAPSMILDLEPEPVIFAAQPDDGVDALNSSD